MITEQGYARVRGVLSRRRAAIAITALVGLAAGGLTVWRLEPGYRASAVVRALESQPSHEYVAPMVMEQIGERLKTLRLAVMARPILTSVTEELNLPAARHRPIDELVDAMRGAIEVKVEGEDTYLLSYEDRDPAVARAVVDAVARRFIAHQVARREEVATATIQALAQEVGTLRPQLAHLDARVRDFRIAHNGSLPEQGEGNLRTLDQTTMEINILTTNLDAQNERRRQMLAAAMSPLRHQEDLLAAALHDARTHYTSGHPEVRRIAAELDQLHTRRLDEERDLRLAQGSGPELVALDEAVARTERQIGALRQRQEEVRARVAATAMNGQSLAEMATDLEVVRAKYQAAVGKLHDAELSAAIERGLRGLRYEMVEGAALPRVASRPNRPLWALIACLAALGLALGVGFAIDLRDNSLYTAEELAEVARPLPVLACLPDLDWRAQKEHR